MRSWIITFMIVAAVFALLAIAYVVVDLILELCQRKKTQEASEKKTHPSSDAGAVSPKD